SPSAGRTRTASARTLETADKSRSIRNPRGRRRRFFRPRLRRRGGRRQSFRGLRRFHHSHLRNAQGKEYISEVPDIGNAAGCGEQPQIAEQHCKKEAEELSRSRLFVGRCFYRREAFQQTQSGSQHRKVRAQKQNKTR